jgi:hypothetical protein
MGDERLREPEPEGSDHVIHFEEGEREDGRVVGNLKNIKYVQQHSKENIFFNFCAFSFMNRKLRFFSL